MRHRHWWGVAAGAGVLVCAVIAAPAANAAPAAAPAKAGVVASGAQAKPAKPTHQHVRKGRYAPLRHGHKPGKPNNGNPGHNHPGHPGGHHHGNPRPYPSKGEYHIAMDVSKKHHSGTLKVVAKVSINGVVAANAQVGLYGSINGGKTWKLYTTVKTDKNGTAVFSFSPQHRVTLRTAVAGGNGIKASVSNTADIKKK